MNINFNNNPNLFSKNKVDLSAIKSAGKPAPQKSGEETDKKSNILNYSKITTKPETSSKKISLNEIVSKKFGGDGGNGGDNNVNISEEILKQLEADLKERIEKDLKESIARDLKDHIAVDLKERVALDLKDRLEIERIEYDIAQEAINEGKTLLKPDERMDDLQWGMMVRLGKSIGLSDANAIADLTDKDIESFYAEFAGKSVSEADKQNYWKNVFTTDDSGNFIKDENRKISRNLDISENAQETKLATVSAKAIMVLTDATNEANHDNFLNAMTLLSEAAQEDIWQSSVADPSGKKFDKNLYKHIDIYA